MAGSLKQTEGMLSESLERETEASEEIVSGSQKSISGTSGTAGGSSEELTGNMSGNSEEFTGTMEGNQKEGETAYQGLSDIEPEIRGILGEDSQQPILGQADVNAAEAADGVTESVRISLGTVMSSTTKMSFIRG